MAFSSKKRTVRDPLMMVGQFFGELFDGDALAQGVHEGELCVQEVELRQPDQL